MKNTTKQTLLKIIEGLDAGKLGATDSYGRCVYRTEGGGEYCAIGYVLSPEAHEIIDRKEWDDSTPADDLFDALLIEGYDACEELGLTSQQALALQNWHDDSFIGEAPVTPDDFREVLQALVDGEVSAIANAPGILRSFTVQF